MSCAGIHLADYVDLQLLNELVVKCEYDRIQIDLPVVFFDNVKNVSGCACGGFLNEGDNEAIVAFTVAVGSADLTPTSAVESEEKVSYESHPCPIGPSRLQQAVSHSNRVVCRGECREKATPKGTCGG